METNNEIPKKIHRKKLSKRNRTLLFVEQDGRCYYCKDRIPFIGNAIGEHKIPLSRGGTNKLDNFVLACFTCDHYKGAMTDTEFFEVMAQKKGRMERFKKMLVEKGLYVSHEVTPIPKVIPKIRDTKIAGNQSDPNIIVLINKGLY